MMIPKFGVGRAVIYTRKKGDDKDGKYKGEVVNAERVPGTDFFKHDVTAREKWGKPKDSE